MFVYRYLGMNEPSHTCIYKEIDDWEQKLSGRWSGRTQKLVARNNLVSSIASVCIQRLVCCLLSHIYREEMASEFMCLQYIQKVK